MSDSNIRSITKTVTWRITGSSAAVIIAYLVTGSIGISSTIGLMHLVVNTFLYWIHERIWAKITWESK